MHNRYEILGGEDSVVDTELNLLNKKHQTVSFYESNTDIKGFWRKIVTAFNLSFSEKSKDKLLACISANNPEIAHAHNFFPKLTPSIFQATHETGVASVLTLHNFRTICPTALLMHKGSPCERSLFESAFWAVPHKVYRNSYIGTAALAYMIEYHKRKKTWQTKVDRFICLTEFSKSKFIQAGFPAHKIIVKPNFIEDPGFDGNSKRDNKAVFVGRLSEEKGIEVLLKSWRNIDYQVDVIGEGDCNNSLKDYKNLNLLGRMPKEDVIRNIKRAQFIIVPSICYEGFPMAIVEAFACGTPVICSRLGSMEEIVKDGVTGLHFEAGDSQDLAEKVKWIIDNPREARKMGQNARNEYLDKYTPEKNYELLMGIYREAIEEANSRK